MSDGEVVGHEVAAWHGAESKQLFLLCQQHMWIKTSNVEMRRRYVSIFGQLWLSPACALY
jgi:hypothetical protein